MKYIKKFEDIEKLYYDTELLKPFIYWFSRTYKERMDEEGWFISYAMGLTPPPNFEEGHFWQVQHDSDKTNLYDDTEADKLAEKLGLMLIKDWGIVIGYNGVNFLEHPEELEIYKDANKYNL